MAPGTLLDPSSGSTKGVAPSTFTATSAPAAVRADAMVKAEGDDMKTTCALTDA